MKIKKNSFFEKHSPTCENSPSNPKNKILEESTLLSQEVKQSDKEIPLIRPCWMDRSEVWTHYLKPLLISECCDNGWMSFVEWKQRQSRWILMDRRDGWNETKWNIIWQTNKNP